MDTGVPHLLHRSLRLAAKFSRVLNRLINLRALVPLYHSPLLSSKFPTDTVDWYSKSLPYSFALYSSDQATGLMQPIYSLFRAIYILKFFSCLPYGMVI